MDSDLRMLLDEREINALVQGNCQMMDFGRRDEWVDCFTDDAVYDVRLPDNSLYARVEGRVALREFIAGFPRAGLHKHIYTTPLIDLDSAAGTATGEVTFMMLSIEGPGVEVSAFGRSSDRFVRTPSGWKFQERVIVTEAMTTPAT